MTKKEHIARSGGRLPWKEQQKNPSWLDNHDDDVITTWTRYHYGMAKEEVFEP